MGVADERCTMLAAEQHGCISAEQALRCGLSSDAVFRRARSGRWRRMLPAVYAVSGAPATWEQRLMAAVLWAGDGTAIARTSAAALWRLPGFGPGRVEIYHPTSKRSRHGVVVHRVRLDPGDVTRLRGWPVTTAGRTLVDVSSKLDAASFDTLFHHCLHTRLTTWRALQDLSERHSGSGCPGAGRLRAALLSYGLGGRAAASPLEARLARRLGRSELPKPLRQHEVRVGGARRYLDFAWPEARVAVEVDGYRWHSSRGAWERDRARLRELRRAGWTIIHATKQDVDERFEGLLHELTSLLGGLC